MTELMIAAAALAIWLYLLTGRGGFWIASQRDDVNVPARPANWPAITAIIPARDEAPTIGDTIQSLLRQDYKGSLRIILVDDDSQDGTDKVAREAAASLGAEDRLSVLRGAPLPTGWTGKLWAVKQGVEAAERLPDRPDYLLLTDADIAYAPDAVSRLVTHAQRRGFVQTSLMVKLRCQSFAERALVPAFIYFFQLLYPFSWVNRPDHPTAAAAGGCMLVRPDALRKAGGIEAIRGALIDDCALAGRLKEHGPIWLGLTGKAHSVRRYPRFEDIRRMVARSAYSQLRYSPLLLVGTIGGLALTYWSGPLLALFGDGIPRVIGVIVWALMALSFVPILRFYQLSPFWSPTVPLIALIYMAFTLDSAYQHARGRGGVWKGRVQAHVSERR